MSFKTAYDKGLDAGVQKAVMKVASDFGVNPQQLYTHYFGIIKQAQDAGGVDAASLGLAGAGAGAAGLGGLAHLAGQGKENIQSAVEGRRAAGEAMRAAQAPRSGTTFGAMRQDIASLPDDVRSAVIGDKNVGKMNFKELEGALSQGRKSQMSAATEGLEAAKKDVAKAGKGIAGRLGQLAGDIDPKMLKRLGLGGALLGGGLGMAGLTNHLLGE